MTKLEETVNRYHCDFCPQTFENGTLLRYHIGDEHPEIVNALLKALPKEKENEDMLPSAGSGGNRSGRGGGAANNSLPYLSAAVLTTEEKEATIIAVKNEPNHNFGPSVVVKLTLEGKNYLWTLNVKKNPNFEILLNKFGKDETKWSGKKILLVLEQDAFSEQFNIRTHFPNRG